MTLLCELGIAPIVADRGQNYPNFIGNPMKLKRMLELFFLPACIEWDAFATLAKKQCTELKWGDGAWNVMT